MEKPWVYMDTSAYLKLFISERGSEDALVQARRSKLLSSAILPVECVSALSRRHRLGEIEDAVLETLLKTIKKHILSVEIIRITDEILNKAEDVCLRSEARAMDAIHIASALVFQESAGINVGFITSDTKQAESVRITGMKTLLIH
jgi:predicted nucleic acid-binding protein